MGSFSEDDHQLTQELKQTIQSLRRQLDACHISNKTKFSHQLIQHEKAESAMQDTVIELRKQLEQHQVDFLDLKRHLTQNKSLYSSEKTKLDENFHVHVLQVRNNFENKIAELHRELKKQKHLNQLELKDMQAMILQLRHQLETKSDSPRE